MQKSQASAETDTQRLEAFSDGVFAIAITVLIVEIKVPQVNPAEGMTNSLSLASALLGLRPSYFAYIFSGSSPCGGNFRLNASNRFRLINDFIALPPSALCHR